MPFSNVNIDRPKGFNSDLSPYELPPDVFTTSLNTDNSGYRTNRAKGAVNAYGALAIQPLFAMPWNDGSQEVWLYADETDIYKINSATSETQMVTSLGGTFLQGWSGDVFNGVAVLNNTLDPPQYSSTSSVMADLANWPTDYRCGVIRPFKNYLVALDVTDDLGTRQSSLVKWSSPADVGSVPDSWATDDPAEQAGETVLSDTPGAIVDGQSLGNSFIIYKQDSVWAMDFIGGQYVFQFRKLFDDTDGILARDCVVEFEGKHFVLTKGDAYVHDGTSKKSIMSSRVKSSLFQLLDIDYWTKTRVVSDPANKNIWVYYVPQGETTNLATKALVWNWQSDSWSERDLIDVAFIAAGPVGDDTSDAWDDDPDDWNEDTTQWNQGAYTPDQDSLVACDYTNSQFLKLESGTTWDGASYQTQVERIGIDFEDASVWKKINAIYPSMQGSGTVNFYIGHEDPQGSGMTYEGPYPYVIGEDYKINCRVNGRNISIKVESDTDDIWSLSGYTIEWKPTRAMR